MKFKSALMTSGSGSVGGMTLSRNRGGMFLRARAIPVNPNTDAQGAARAAMAAIVNQWSNVLTDSQRNGWTAYANNTPVVDVLGDQLILTGQQMFVKTQLPRQNAGLAIVEDGPAISGLATTPIITVPGTVGIVGGLDATITVPGAGTDGYLLYYISEPASPARNPAHQRRRLVGTQGPPVADVFVLNVPAAQIPWTLYGENTVRVTYVYTGGDGRVSSEVFEDIVIGP